MKHTLQAFVSFFLAALSCKAASIIVPESAVGREGSSNINAAYWLQGRTQQVINATEFDGFGLVLVNSVAYRSDSVFWRKIDVTFTDLNIRVSTTSAYAQALSRVYDQNLGPDLVEVFAGNYHLVASGEYRQFVTLFTFDNPFLYDPAAGNLLIDFRFMGEQVGVISEYSAFDRISSTEGSSTDSTSGLRSTDPLAVMTSNIPSDPPILQIAFTQIPEPQTVFLFAIGAILTCRRSRNNKSVVVIESSAPNSLRSGCPYTPVPQIDVTN